MNVIYLLTTFLFQFFKSSDPIRRERDSTPNLGIDRIEEGEEVSDKTVLRPLSFFYLDAAKGMR